MNPTITEVGLAREVAFLSARAAAAAARLANAALAPLGLKVRSYSILSLAAESMPPSQRELAEFLLLDPSQVVALVDDLERRGWVTRAADAADRRVNVIVATEAGTRVCAEAVQATRMAEDEAFGALDADERTRLVELLQKVATGR